MNPNILSEWQISSLLLYQLSQHSIMLSESFELSTPWASTKYSTSELREPIKIIFSFKVSKHKNHLLFKNNIYNTAKETRTLNLNIRSVLLYPFEL